MSYQSPESENPKYEVPKYESPKREAAKHEVSGNGASEYEVSKHEGFTYETPARAASDRALDGPSNHGQAIVERTAFERSASEGENPEHAAVEGRAPEGKAPEKPASEGLAPEEGASERALPAPAPSQQALSERKSRTAAYVAAACVVLLVALSMLGSIMNVGDHLAAAHPVLGWVFYGLLVVLVAVGVVVPMVKVARRPIFSLYQLRDEKGRAKRARCRMLVDNLVANTDLTDQEIDQLNGYLQAGDEADDLLIEFFNKKCVPKIDNETKRAATTAFFVAMVARSPLIGMVTMMSLCLDLVRAIVEICGFRPTNLGLARLYTRVMISALIVGGIEDSDLSDMLGQLMGGGAGGRAGGLVLGAAAEGLVSAFLVFRVGIITKRWLTAADGPARMASIRRTSYREALALMRTSGFMQMVTETVKQTTGAVAASVAESVAETAKSKAAQAKASAVSVTSSMAESMADVARSGAAQARASAASAKASILDLARFLTFGDRDEN